MRCSRRLAVFAVVVTGFALSGCSDEEAPTTAATETTSEVSPAPTSTTSTTIPADPLIADLCAVMSAASGGEIEVAKTTFDHGPLHTLAEELLDVDRSVAARLLEAKEAVEADLAAAAADGRSLVTDLGALITATGNALVTNGNATTPPTCDPEDQ